MLSHDQIEWVLGFLADSGPLGKLLFDRKAGLDFSAAKVFPIAAQGRDFRCGLPDEPEFNGNWDGFVSEIEQALKHEGAFCLFRECDAKRSDPCMGTGQYPMIFAGEDIYYFLRRLSSWRQIRETIKLADRLSLLMCEFKDSPYIPVLHDEITYEKLNGLLERLSAIAVSVCDDEGVCYIPYDSRRCEDAV